VVDVVEDMFLFGHLDHLVSATDLVPFLANANLDLHAFFAAIFFATVHCLYKVAAFGVSLCRKQRKKAKVD